MRTAILLACVLATSSAAIATETNKYGQLMLTDGVSLYPNAMIPTPGEVSAVDTRAAQVSIAAESVYSASVALAAQADDFAVKLSALNGTTIVYGSCVAFGSQSIEVNTNATGMIIAQEFPSNTVDTIYMNLYVHYTETLKAAPDVEQASNLTAATWVGIETLETELTTYPVAGVNVECYRLLIGIPGTVNNLYVRTKGELQESVIGQFNILENLTINGVSGLTTTNAIGIHINGLLVKELDSGKGL